MDSVTQATIELQRTVKALKNMVAAKDAQIEAL